MRRGPKNKSDAELIASGSRRVKDRVRLPPRGYSASVEPPAWLSAEALNVWRAVIAGLKYLAAADAVVAGRYCTYVAKWVELCQLADRVNLVKAIQAGLLGQLTKIETALHRLEAELGLTPAARRGLVAEDEAEESDDAAKFRIA